MLLKCFVEDKFQRSTIFVEQLVRYTIIQYGWFILIFIQINILGNNFSKRVLGKTSLLSCLGVHLIAIALIFYGSLPIKGNVRSSHDWGKPTSGGASGKRGSSRPNVWFVNGRLWPNCPVDVTLTGHRHVRRYEVCCRKEYVPTVHDRRSGSGLHKTSEPDGVPEPARCIGLLLQRDVACLSVYIFRVVASEYLCTLHTHEGRTQIF